MKKSIAIYLAFFSLLFAGVSCSGDDDGVTITGTPYAFISSFAIDNILSPFHDVTVEGKDTIVQKLVSGDEFKFVVDQKTKEIYNTDSLTYGTRVDKVATFLSYTGVPQCYDAEAGDYVYYYSVDSLDFTSPVSVRVQSTDGTYENYYTIKINVHQVDPDLLVWESFPVDEAVAALTPRRLVERDGVLYLFCTDAAGAAFVAVSSAQGTPSWTLSPVDVAAADVSQVQLFGGAFYMVTGGALYSSVDGASWTPTAADAGLVALLAVCDNGTTMWVADGENILSTTDGVSFAVAEPLPADFPIYGCSSASYPLVTNNKIFRSVVVGYADEAMSGDVKVWSKLSTENGWCAYEQPNSDYKCPPMAGLQVLHYDNAFFALGGAATMGDKAIAPFASFYVSKDNGIAWRLCKDYALQLPASLKGCTQPFASAVTADNYMWIITPAAAWRGRINRLGF